MSEKTKNIIINSVIGIAITLLIVGLIVGIFGKGKNDSNPKKEKKEVVREYQKQLPEQDPEQEKVTETQEETDEVEQEETKEQKQNFKNEETLDIQLDGLEDIDLMDLDESERNYSVEDGPSLSDYFKPEEIKATKEIAEKFVRSYHGFDGKNPLGNFEDSKPYVANGLYEQISELLERGEGVIRPTPDFFKRVVTKVEMRESRYINEVRIIWEARVTSEIQNEKGKKTMDDFTVYLLEFGKEDGKYKVFDFITNIPT